MDAAHQRQPAAPTLSQIYDDALPEVYRYLRGRCGSVELAEELTSATFLQAATTAAARPHQPLTVGWLITVARHKLVDHWRRMAVAERALTVVDGGVDDIEEPWDAVLDQTVAADTLARLSARHRSALTLRYLDDLSVSECAELLDLTVHATESLLVRARAAFRSAYEASGGHDV